MTFPIDKFKQRLINIGLQEAAYNERLTEWVARYGDTMQTRKDFFWHVYQTLLSSAAKDYSNDLQTMYKTHRNIYLEMFAFLCEEGKSVYPAQKGIDRKSVV